MPERNCGIFKSIAGVTCVVIGTGALQIPYAFSKTGWFGIAIVILSGGIGSYTGVLTIRCLYYKGNDEERLHSFPDIGYAAFGRWGRYAAQFFNYMYTLGTACLYIILAGQFIFQMLSPLGVNVTKKVWMILVAIIMWIPVALVKSMTEAAFMTISGLVASIIVILIATIMSFLFPYSTVNPNEVPANHDFIIAAGIPVALSSIVFSFAGSVVYPHVEATMARPKQWPKVMCIAMAMCAIMYLIIGISGYWAYGSKVQTPVLDSIPTGPPNTIAKIMITLHVIVAAPIMLLSFYLEIENAWKITPERLGKKREYTVRLIYRSVVVVALYGFKVIRWYEAIWMGFVLILGMVASIWGSVDAIKSLISDITK
ncbi:hypothetical protein DL89DRAFT_274051 [Linderina pennispora]|uniref:Amino acid transporter transmembrane domain-containing protein n=1 Tax=Linderina pennispora TaxID=61395 RepID=A0A1Y1WHN3_9FUNG|nr:uncharacterized protein DL89DRAFT_274051 [Linderina pennispora]ORX73023.1 hypothetical protein DL89DRAFT_274051 [Linderina pennispora]